MRETCLFPKITATRTRQRDDRKSRFVIRGGAVVPVGRGSLKVWYFGAFFSSAPVARNAKGRHATSRIIFRDFGQYKLPAAYRDAVSRAWIPDDNAVPPFDSGPRRDGIPPAEESMWINHCHTPVVPPFAYGHCSATALLRPSDSDFRYVEERSARWKKNHPV